MIKILLLIVALTLPHVGGCSIPQIKTMHILDNGSEAAAQYNAGIGFYSTGNAPLAVELFRQAAKSGLPEAQYNLAVAYDLGAGVEQDMEKAV